MKVAVVGSRMTVSFSLAEQAIAAMGVQNE